jgi:protein AIR1/2
VPCDLCGSVEHVENGCDMMWKIPKRDNGSGQIFISVSCCHCTSNQHLVGDCPTRPLRMSSSSWTLKHHEPSMISRLKSLPHNGLGRGPHEVGSSLYRIQGRADTRSPSPESDGVFGRPDNWPRIRNNTPRPHIRFNSSIGERFQKNSSRQHDDKSIPHDYRRGYRDREQFFGNNTRQRSLSPDPYPPRRRNYSDSWYPPPRPSPQNQARTQPLQTGHGRGRGDGSSRGRGKFPRAGSDRDTYRPLPSAARKPRDQHRL